MPGFNGLGQVQTKVKNRIFHNSNLSSTNTITMFVFRKVAGDFYCCKTLLYIFCTLYNWHEFKMTANMLNTNYYYFNVQ